MDSPSDFMPPISDVVGIGFGPSNLALAVALRETAPTGTTAVFLEQRQRFGWHAGLLLAGATMQVSFLKDLVSMRNPSSRYSFVSYLHARDRLPEFINSQTIFPLRTEFHDYLEWVAGHFDSQVSYGSRAVQVRPVRGKGRVDYLDVLVTRGDTARPVLMHRTRNVVIGTGLAAHLPPQARASRRVWHSGELLHRIDDLGRSSPGRIVVVGAGQSAAEVTEHLHRRFVDAEICAIFSRYGYSVADDSPFVNGVFDPKAVDLFFGAHEDVKQALLDYHANTNYSVVDAELSRSLFRAYYEELVLQRPRLRIMNVSRVRSVVETEDSVLVEVEFLPTGDTQTLEADAVIYATGYRPSDPLPLLTEVAPECKQDAHGRLTLDRRCRVVTSDVLRCGIYLHGAVTEHSHGLGAGLLSNTAVRAGEIADSIITHVRSGR